MNATMTRKKAAEFPWLQTEQYNGNATHPDIPLVGHMGAYFGTMTRARPELVHELLRRSNLHDTLGRTITEQAEQIERLKAVAQALRQLLEELQGTMTQRGAADVATSLSFARSALANLKVQP